MPRVDNPGTQSGRLQKRRDLPHKAGWLLDLWNMPAIVDHNQPRLGKQWNGCPGPLQRDDWIAVALQQQDGRLNRLDSTEQVEIDGQPHAPIDDPNIMRVSGALQPYVLLFQIAALRLAALFDEQLAE